jgi:hypothetical protein
MANARATGRKTESAARNAARAAQAGPMEERIVELARDIGRILDSAQANATAWIDRRPGVAAQLKQIRDTASSLLGQPGRSASAARSATAGGSAARAAANRKASGPSSSTRKKRKKA